MATVVDVAREAGVSLATVSRVLNGTAPVSPTLRERVEAAVRVLGFRPNPMAQGLRKGQSSSVALLVGDIAQRHFAELTLRVQATLEERGRDLLLFNLGHSEERLAAFCDRAGSMRLAGVIVALSDTVPRATAARFAALRREGVAVVSIGQDLRRLGVPSIVHEERAATHRSVSYLLARGRRRIAYVGRIKGSAIGAERFRGYHAALAGAGRYDDTLVWDRTYRYQAGYEAVAAALDRGLAFDALQAGSDEIATGAMAALADRGCDVPRDVAVIGFGDVEMGSYLRPALTTLSTHPDAAAHHASDLLDDDPAAAPRVVQLARQLIERASA